MGLRDEILEQPAVLARWLETQMDAVRAVAAAIAGRDIEYVFLAARGTSDHAGVYAQYVWGSRNRLAVALAAPSLFTMYPQAPRVAKALVVGISQSGQSPDIVAVLEEGRRQGRPTLAITNDGSSPLAAAADHVIELHAGPERSVAATKTYTAQLVVMALLAAAWSGEPERFAELARVPEALASTLAGTTALEPIAERYRSAQHIVVIGRGYNYATALELALKLKELTYVMTNAYSAADFRHGPIATVSAGVPVVLVMPEGAVLPDLVEMANDLKSRGAELLILSNSATANPLANTLLPFAGTLPEWLSPIAAIVPGQLLALRLALARGSNPDRPRGLQKVTLTR